MAENLIALNDNIYQLDAHYMAPDLAAIYLLKQGNQLAIIETGSYQSIPHIQQAITSLGLTLNDVRYIIPTHIHLDHAGGAGVLMSRCPQAELVIHPRGARHMADPSKLEAGTRAVYGDERFESLYGKSLMPIAEDRMIIADDDFTIDFSGRTLRFLDTPGHAKHHFCVFDELSQGFFTGDTFGIGMPKLNTPTGPMLFATTTPVHFDPDAMRNSIDRLMQYNPKHMYLTHYGRIQPSEREVEQLKSSIDAYVSIALKYEHKQEDRKQAIQSDIQQWLLDQLKAENCPLTASECRAVIQLDSELNAQGLDVWLNRRSHH